MNFRPWLLVLLVLLVTAAIRIRLLTTPLERDEGEYAYAGQLILQGIPPYLLAANMKLPGTYAAYAVILGAFGQSITAIHVGLLFVNAGAIVLVFLLGRRLFGAAAGVAACAAYALMTLGEGVMGTQAHATHFVVLPALAGILLLLRHADSGSRLALFAAGLLLGLAFVMKQHGIFYVFFGALYEVARNWRRWRALAANLILYLCAAAVPFAVTCLWLWRAGVFSRFWFWTFSYARAYASENSLSDGVDAFKGAFVPIFQQNAGLWILAAAGFVFIWWKHRDRPTAIFATAFLAFSALAICPGLYFREHYFVLLLPAVALLAGAAIRSRLAYCLFAAALIFSLFTQREFLFRLTPVEICRTLYGVNPFPESIQVAAYIRNHSAPAARVAVLGSEPQIYFYSHRHSATSYIYTFALMETQPYALRMQNEMIHEIETAAPEYVVFETSADMWQRQTDSPTRIFDWWSAYQPQHYRLVGVADTISEDHVEYRWDAAAETYQPRSENRLEIYRRM